MSVIEVLNASKTYGTQEELKVEALKPVSFSIEKGEFVCIIGTSGSGKSTLLHLLAGVDNATTGSIMINGKDITKLDRQSLSLFRRREVGIIYQFFNLVPVLTAKENIELPLKLDEKKVDQNYFNEIIELLGIKARLNFYPSKLSGGEQQRVAIARALIHQPSIILADEPTGNLNSKLAKEIMEFLVLACKKYNQTIVMITHDLNLAGYADRVLEIHDGMIVRDYKTADENHQIRETEIKRINKEEILRGVSKSEILQAAQDKINNAYFEPEIDEELEGYHKDTNQYVIDYDQFMQALISLYNLEMKGEEGMEVSDGLQTYFNWFKEANAKMWTDKTTLVLYNTRRNKAVETFKETGDILNFILTLQRKRIITQKRSAYLIKFINQEDDR